MEFKYKNGQKVLLRDDAKHAHQKCFWHSLCGVITNCYISRNHGGPWYEIEVREGYRRVYGNSYPESDLYLFGMATNQEAKQLLSKEW